jgi:hypothetical protein
LRWEHALRELADAETELARRQAARPKTLTGAERAAILALGDDLGQVWDAPTTTDKDRKRLLRTLLDEVNITLRRDDPGPHARLVLRWKGGAKIRDGRFLRLIDGLLRAGYLEDWRYHATLSGCPQGGVVSPNIYLDRLDTYIEQNLLPAHNRGARRTPYRPYMRLWQRAWRLEQQGDRVAGRPLRKQMKTMPSRDPGDPGYRRLRYCRYADDWLLGFTGPRQEAEQIKARIGEFLHDQLKLELSPAKTLITHGRTQAARFLGYEIGAPRSAL